MLNKKRKGFTIVELVIVIAVIAVLAAVLIPTFAGIIDKANESAALQDVQNAYINALADALGSELKDTTVEADGFKFTFSDSTGQNATIEVPDDFNYSAKVENGVIVLGPASGGGTGGAGVLTIDNLATAFAQGGEFKLPEGGLTISSALEVAEGAELSIDLNGNTLTLGTGEDDQNWTCSPISVSGTLTITGSGNSAVEIATYDFSNAGIHVQSGGTLNLTDIAVNDNLAMKGIENDGDANFTNVNFTVDNGRGLVNTGDVVISGGEFSGGEAPAYLIYSTGGTMEIDKTTFSGTCSSNVIQLNTTGTLYLENVIMTTTSANVATTSDTPVEISGGSFAGTISGQYAISDGTFADVSLLGESSVSGGTFNGLLTFSQYSETTITGGTFTGGFYGDTATVTIEGGTFSGLLDFYHKFIVNINGGTFNNKLRCETDDSNRGKPTGTKITIKNVNSPVFSDGTDDPVYYDEISAAILADPDYSRNPYAIGCELSGNAADGWTIS